MESPSSGAALQSLQSRSEQQLQQHFRCSIVFPFNIIQTPTVVPSGGSYQDPILLDIQTEISKHDLNFSKCQENTGSEFKVFLTK